jgi:hypothetical protein
VKFKETRLPEKVGLEAPPRELWVDKACNSE